MTPTQFISVFFVLIALILLVVLVFLYKLSLAMGRLDRRLEQLARHLQDLNLYDLHPVQGGVFGTETEMEGGSSRASSTDTESFLSPPGGESSDTSASDNASPGDVGGTSTL